MEALYARYRSAAALALEPSNTRHRMGPKMQSHPSRQRQEGRQGQANEPIIPNRSGSSGPRETRQKQTPGSYNRPGSGSSFPYTRIAGPEDASGDAWRAGKACCAEGRTRAKGRPAGGGCRMERAASTENDTNEDRYHRTTPHADVCVAEEELRLVCDCNVDSSRHRVILFVSSKNGRAKGVSNPTLQNACIATQDMPKKQTRFRGERGGKHFQQPSIKRHDRVPPVS